MNTALGLLVAHAEGEYPSARTTELDAKFRGEVSRRRENFRQTIKWKVDTGLWRFRFPTDVVFPA
jgi:hypothetical protein